MPLTTSSAALAPMPFAELLREALVAPRHRKFATISVLASFLVPGLGSVINGSRLRGAVFFTGFVASLLLLGPVVEVIAMFGFWVFSLVDAYEGSLS